MSNDTEFAPVVFATIENTSAGSSAQTERIDRALAQAEVRGHAAGYATGLRAATAIAEERMQLLEAQHAEASARSEALLAHAHAAMERAVIAVQQASLPVLAESDNAVLAAAIELAEAVLGRELSHSEDGAAVALRRVFSGLGGERDQPGIVVRMHPEDVASLTHSAQTPASLTFIADGSLGRGDAVAEFADGVIDARIGTAVERARAALLGQAS